MKTLRTFSLFAIMMLTFTIGATAGELENLQQRMSARVGQIDQLKKAKVVGENNKGYLEFVGDQQTDAQTQLVTLENTDRQAVYRLIAEKSGSNFLAVGVQRAEQIRNQSAGGVMVQMPSGDWVTK